MKCSVYPLKSVSGEVQYMSKINTPDGSIKVKKEEEPLPNAEELQFLKMNMKSGMEEEEYFEEDSS